MKKIEVFCIGLLIGVTLPACKAKGSQSEQDKKFTVLVYITGVTADSPTYEMLADGALEFAEENDNVTVKVYEAGFNQAEWEEQLQSMIAGGEYDLVVGSNPSLPEICANISRLFPSQKFIITDAQDNGNPQISTRLYNQYEQALFLGYLAGLVTKSKMTHANTAKRIGFIAAQAFPQLTRDIVPGFLDGARLVDPEIELDYRIIGNWIDANKASELAVNMIRAGVDVFTSIAGGASQGLFRTIQEQGAYAVCFNTNEYAKAPGFIVGCGQMEQKKLVKELLADALAGNIQYGTGITLGVKEGYLNFISDDPSYLNSLPPDIREKFDSFIDDLRAGKIEYTVPAITN
jgi:simple sugar transport system substrate-binding protein